MSSPYHQCAPIGYVRTGVLVCCAPFSNCIGIDDSGHRHIDRFDLNCFCFWAQPLLYVYRHADKDSNGLISALLGCFISPPLSWSIPCTLNCCNYYYFFSFICLNEARLRISDKYRFKCNLKIQTITSMIKHRNSDTVNIALQPSISSDFFHNFFIWKSNNKNINNRVFLFVNYFHIQSWFCVATCYFVGQLFHNAHSICLHCN